MRAACRNVGRLTPTSAAMLLPNPYKLLLVMTEIRSRKIIATRSAVELDFTSVIFLPFTDFCSVKLGVVSSSMQVYCTNLASTELDEARVYRNFARDNMIIGPHVNARYFSS